MGVANRVLEQTRIPLDGNCARADLSCNLVVQSLWCTCVDEQIIPVRREYSIRKSSSRKRSVGVCGHARVTHGNPTIDTDGYAAAPFTIKLKLKGKSEWECGRIIDIVCCQSICVNSSDRSWRCEDNGRSSCLWTNDDCPDLVNSCSGGGSNGRG